MIRIKKLTPWAGVRLPAPGDAGIDIYPAPYKSVYYIYPRGVTHFRTGLVFEIPHGFVGLLKDRSSLAARGVHIVGGVIDSSYRGEVIVIMANFWANRTIPIDYSPIAQLVVVPCITGPGVIVEQLTETQRGTKGFGSTDV